ncbi:MAG TPA: IPT/TIG domain-containing protein [Thermoanaerobaculia bacterium]|nr:IPT/TIG domain-containing protein [Thermoanaerobaculia bacterium]
MLRVTAVLPDSGDVNGGTRVVIHGTSFALGAAVQIGGRDAAVVSVTPAEIVVLTPAADAPGAAHVTVTLPDGLSVTRAQALTYTTLRRHAAR